MVESLRLFNVFGVVTIFPGKAIALGVSVLPNRKSIERTLARDVCIEGLEGTHQVLFGAKVKPGRAPEIAVFQLEEPQSGSPDLLNLPEIQALLQEVVKKVQEALLS